MNVLQGYKKSRFLPGVEFDVNFEDINQKCEEEGDDESYHHPGETLSHIDCIGVARLGYLLCGHGVVRILSGVASILTGKNQDV